MKIFVILVILISLLSSVFSSPESQAISDVISQLYPTKNGHQPELDFIFFKKFSIDLKNEFRVQNFRLQLPPHKIRKKIFMKFEKAYFVTKNFIILVENLKNVMKYLDEPTPARRYFFKQTYLLFYVDKVEDENLLWEIEKIDFVPSTFKAYAQHRKYFTYLLLNYKHKLTLVTFDYYSENFCGKFQVKLINEFSKKPQKWKNELKIEEKLKNFHNCTLIFSSKRKNLIVREYKNPLTGKFEGKFLQLK